MPIQVHYSADIGKNVRLGSGAEILQFVVVRAGASIGAGTRVCSHVYIDCDVRIGQGCNIKNGARIYKGVHIGREVFIGPNVCFTNDASPKAFEKHTPPFPITMVEDKVSIGASAVILPGVTIGRGAVVGAGAVVTKDVDPRTTVVGIPAKVVDA